MAAVHAHIPIRLQPRARRSEVVGERAGAIVVRVDGAEEAAVRAALHAWS